MKDKKIRFQIEVGDKIEFLLKDVSIEEVLHKLVDVFTADAEIEEISIRVAHRVDMAKIDRTFP